MSEPIADSTEQESTEQHFGKKFKHTLDSDEEDDEVDAEKYNILDTEQIEGTEKATVDFDGDIKITPFNMDEELETGHFDKEGTYIFKKDDDIRDNWLDNIDWAKIRQPTSSSNNSQSDEEDTAAAGSNIEDLYMQIVQLVAPGETIQRALQRFGKDCPKVKRGQKRKADSANVDEAKAKAAKENIAKLTSLADMILQTGDMDIYEKKYEDFQHHLNRIKNERKAAAPADDMFSDDFDAASKKASTSSPPPAPSAIMWEFKWQNTDDAKVHGPHTSSEMLDWANSDHFKDGVFVRRTDSDKAEFYNSKRIDFDLYI